MSLPRYAAYMPTGHEILTEVPVGWRALPLRAVGRLLKGYGGSKEDIVEDGLPCVRYGDLYTTHSSFIESSRTRISREVAATYAEIRRGDVLFAASGETFEDIGKSAVNLIDGPAYSGGDVIILRPGIGVDHRYLGYACDSRSAVLQKVSMGRGTTVKHIYPDELRHLTIALPSEAGQLAISSFLDRETAKIDALIAEQERLIELLKEKRQAAISNAVTKGLDPSALMKASGVEWLGDIPAHWDVSQSRRLFRVRNERARGSDEQLTASQKHGILLQADFVEREGRRVVEIIRGTDSLRHVEPNDFIISLRSFQGGIEWSRLAGSVTFHYVVLAPIRDVHEAYFAHLFKSDSYIQALRSTANLIRDGQDLRFSHFVQVGLPLVPLGEQRQIAARLSEENGRTDELIAEVQAAQLLLAERRSALISAAVTGQIDVRAA